MFFVPPPVILGGPVTVDYRELRHSNGNNSTVTFTDVSWGIGGNRRTLIAFVYNYNIRSSTPRTVSGLTIGGNSATEIARFNGATSPTAREVVAYALRDTAGDLKTCDISFVGGAGTYTDQNIWLGAWSVYSLRSLTPVDKEETSVTTADIPLPVTTEAGGIVLAGALINRSTSWTTANATERFDANEGGTGESTVVGADALTAGGTVTPTFTKATGLAASIVGVAVSLR
jgi:hypothetical protein